MEKSIVVSACLLGECVRYDGKVKNTLPNLEKLKEKYNVIPICPELLGDLGMPRPKSEITDGKVINEKGEDVTEKFIKGAEKAYKIFKENNAVFAVLKESSPSCGGKTVYDGTFSGNKIAGRGITADYFIKHNIEVINEKEILERL